MNAAVCGGHIAMVRSSLDWRLNRGLDCCRCCSLFELSNCVPRGAVIGEERGAVDGVIVGAGRNGAPAGLLARVLMPDWP